MKYIYLAGPYTKNPEQMTSAMLLIASRLIEKNFIPFVPHLCHFWDSFRPEEYEYWFEYVSAWIEKCDALVYVNLSPGVNREIAIAEKAGVPVFTLAEFIKEFT